MALAHIVRHDGVGQVIIRKVAEVYNITQGGPKGNSCRRGPRGWGRRVGHPHRDKRPGGGRRRGARGVWKRVGVDHFLVLSGDAEADLLCIARYYDGVVGQRPEQAAPVRFK